MTTTILVTYAGDARTRFDRDYYLSAHMPLVRQVWGPHGLRSAGALFPADADGEHICVCICTFDDDASLDAAFADPDTRRVMHDVKNFTDVAPSRSRLSPL